MRLVGHGPRIEVQADSQEDAWEAARQRSGFLGFADFQGSLGDNFAFTDVEVDNLEWSGSSNLSPHEWVKQQVRKLRNSGMAEHQILPHLETVIEDGHAEFLAQGLPVQRWTARYQAAYQALAQASGI